MNCGIDTEDNKVLCSECLNKTNDCIEKANVFLGFRSGELYMFSNRLEFKTKNPKKDKIILFSDIQCTKITMKSLIEFTYKNGECGSFAFDNEATAQRWNDILNDLMCSSKNIILNETSKSDTTSESNQQETESFTAHKGLKGLSYNIAHIKQFPKSERKKALKQIILFGSVCIISLIAILIMINPILSSFTPIDMNANNFISNWNHMAKNEDNLTCGIKIKSETGWFDYDLPNGAKLEGQMVKAGIFRKELVYAVYNFPDTETTDIEGFVNEYIALFDEIKNEEEAADELLSEKEALIPSGITGLVCRDKKVEFKYAYGEKYKEINLTGLSFGCSFDEALSSFNDGYSKSIDNTYAFKTSPTDQDL